MHKFLFILVFLSSYNSFADSNRFYINKLNYCKITALSANDYEPENFPTNNDLLRASYYKPRVTDTKIIIRGRVLDENCAPVSDAKVFLWQVGADGKYHYKALKNNINQEMFKEDSEDSNFLGAGSTLTNNQGEFYFITLKPAAINKKSPEVNVRVKHSKLNEVQTKLLLTSANLVKSPIEIRRDFIPIIKDISFYDFQIVLRGETLMRY